MTGNFETILTLLLKYNAGLLESDRAREVSNRIESDPRWHRRWRRLRVNWFDSERSIGDELPQDIAPEWIAGFVDETLSQDVARRLEASAWQSAALLREIAVAFQFANEPVSQEIDEQIDQTRIDRIWMGSLVHEHLNGCESSLPTTNSDERGKSKSAVSDQPVPEATSSRHRKSNRWILALATGVLLLLASTIWLSVTWLMRGQVAEPGTVHGPDTKERENQQPPPPTPAPDQKMERQREDIVNQLNGQPIQRQRELPDDSQMVNDDPLFDEIGDDAKSTPKSVADSKVNDKAKRDAVDAFQVYTPLQPNWTRYEGVIGLRDPASRMTHGYGFVSQLTDEMEITVLPQSWGQGELVSLGEIVVDADTSLRIGKRTRSDAVDQNERFEFQLNHGRFAIKDITADKRLLITTGTARWPVNVQKESVIAVEYVPGAARLFVRRGEIQLRGRALQKGQHVEWQRGHFGAPEKTQQNARWIDRPTEYARISDRYRKQIFNSANVVDELARLGNVSDKSMRLAAAHWTLSLRPAQVARAFRAHDAAHWVETFQWLVQQPPALQRTRVAWRSLAEVIGSPEVTRDLFRWATLVRQNEFPPHAEAEKMVSYLNHDRMFVRFAAAFYLNYYFENPFGYRPDAAARLRGQVIHRWRAHIIDRYHRDQRQRR